MTASQRSPLGSAWEAAIGRCHGPAGIALGHLLTQPISKKRRHISPDIQQKADASTVIQAPQVLELVNAGQSLPRFCLQAERVGGCVRQTPRQVAVLCDPLRWPVHRSRGRSPADNYRFMYLRALSQDQAGGMQ
jgi:hypothetical protein